MKRRFLLPLLILALLFLWACDNNAQNPSESAQFSENDSSQQGISQEFVADEALLGVWVSADEGERQMVETLYFYENGEMIIELDYQGAPYGTLYGTYSIDGHSLVCDITEGTAPYAVTYEYRIDGRMLILTDDDGPAEYLRTS